MTSHIVGYPRMGPKRELKFALESFWEGKSGAEDLKQAASDLRASIWKQMAEVGIKFIPSNRFSYYDHVLDTTAILGAVPPRYAWNGGEIGFEAVEEYKEAKALGIDTVPVLLGPLSYILEVVAELKEAGATWIQFDEPGLVMDLEVLQLQTFTNAYSELESSFSGLNVLIETYFADFPVQTFLRILLAKKVVVSTSCSLLHTAVDLGNETKLGKEIKSWLAFAAQKVVEHLIFFASNATSHASRRSSPRVKNDNVQKAVAALKDSDHRRATSVSARLAAQQKKINDYDYVNAMKEEIKNVVKLQEEVGIDVLVHGEPERNDMVEYFGEQLSGFAFTVNGWVQSYGSRCVKPPIIYGDVSRTRAMTVFWSTMAEGMTRRPMKGMLTGPVTILNWSSVRNDQERHETCYHIALAIKDEVKDLERADISVIQIDEAALREGLPLRKSEQPFYLEWAVQSFRITNCGIKDTTQIHTHMCYSNFNDIINAIINMDADVIAIENSKSDEKLVFQEGVKYDSGIGPGVYDIHSPRIPSTEEVADSINKMLEVLDSKVLWVNPDCGLKTRKYSEVEPALRNMVAAAKLVRTKLASGN
ncbi:5-methyltetrahydropteroyltriglutamate--homocysteine methyltransferase 1 [Hibiscus syriacus]|uniref:5-methyltetrahydropteroyltriglutamate--homocysteine S-methyltransferase n=1 Tax=Hibiscus syriacus TaxID=106335 RepID=A0A6A2ZHE1_HIBSY|nr:5-methyltetrahydropteroyltriglutamate--homocysteine methyltransferase 1 [Hibiscus syriacus]